MSIFHDHSDSNLPRPVSLCPRGLGFHLGVCPIPRAFDVSSPSSRSPPPFVHTSPDLPIAPFEPLSLLSIPSISTVQRIPFLPLSRCLESTDYTPRAKRTPSSALVTAETPELLQRRRGLVSAGWRLHGHRGWLHGPKGGPGQTVVVHITRRPRPADPYSRPVHRRRAA